MQLVLIRGSMVEANKEYSTSPTGLHGWSGRFFRFRADWTRQSSILKTKVPASGLEHS